MKSLSENEFWNSFYEHKLDSERRSLKGRVKGLLERTILGNTVLEYMRSYSEYLEFDVIYPKYVPGTKGAKVLEVGSAPGDYLVRLSQKFGFVPYGVEYSQQGVELNRKVFADHNINPSNVIYADFFSDDFRSQYMGQFDVVISRGFIEHFTNVQDVVEGHVKLLKKGGCLIISIPNLRGLNCILANAFDKQLVSIHNLEIMQKKEFARLFNEDHLETLFCNYYGTFSFTLVSIVRIYLDQRPLKLFLLDLFGKLQLVLNVMFRLLFKDKGLENRLFSPYLIYIGVKK